jgi:hypothetical protein
MGLRIGSGESKQRSAASPGQPVHRLGAADEEAPLQVRPMSEAGPAEPQVSSREERARKGLARWTGWMAVGTCVAVVAAVTGLMLAGKGKVSNAADNPGYVFEKEQQLDRKQEYFLVHSGELTKQAEKLLERYAAATSVEQVLPLVRDAEQVKERMARLWKPWGTDPMLAAGEKIESFVLEESSRAAISLKGSKGDFSPFDMVFIREGEGLKLDWEASHGIGEVQVAELLEGAAAEDRVVRGIIQPTEFYTQAFPESRFRSFRLVDAGGDLFVWVFAPLDSTVASVLKTEFNEGSLLLEKSVQIPATVRLSGTGGSSGKCYEITEMLHKGWVRP